MIKILSILVVASLTHACFGQQIHRKRIIGKGDCRITLNGSSDISETTRKENDLSCVRANMYKNYLLTEVTIICDMKIPKVQAWYYNKDDKYLLTDILK